VFLIIFNIEYLQNNLNYISQIKFEYFFFFFKSHFFHRSQENIFTMNAIYATVEKKLFLLLINIKI
jgi:hypothetical protein